MQLFTAEFVREAIRQEGYNEGHDTGVREGLQRGIRTGLLNGLFDLVRDGHLSADVASAQADISVADFNAQMAEHFR